MEALIKQWISHSAEWAVLAIFCVTFLESLALVGLILPGTIMMATLGALVGSGDIGLYYAWFGGLLGCWIGDWLSFAIGWHFRKPLHNWRYLQKYRSLLDKTEQALQRHSVATILIGRFFGPTRPLVPLAAGMLELPFQQFWLPSLLGCIAWPPLYLLPGILAGAAIDLHGSASEGQSRFLLLLLATLLMLWLTGWLVWKLIQQARHQHNGSTILTKARLQFALPISLLISFLLSHALLKQPALPLFLQVLLQVMLGGPSHPLD
jgi:membrane protein DedA with SNARE-associated domain